MNVVFADTSFYIAFTNPKDAWYRTARDLALEYSGLMITTEFVLVEFGNHLRAPEDRPLFVRWNRLLREDSNTRILPASPELVEAGVSLYGDRLDKGWSLTDCISMTVMAEQDVSAVLTTDHHFEQAGYRVLLSR